MSGLTRNQIMVGDVREVLGGIPTASVDTVITSPPYFRLRDYQHGGQIGLERHVDEWVDELLLVTRGLKRVLKPTGSLWLNLGWKAHYVQLGDHTVSARCPIAPRC